MTCRIALIIALALVAWTGSYIFAGHFNCYPDSAGTCRLTRF